MLHRTVQQFLTDVFFGDLDVLLIDMPPGTGDVAISVGQLLPHADVLVVTTPQTAASDVAVRSGLVAGQTGQRVIGVVENMAAMTLPTAPSRSVRRGRRSRGGRGAVDGCRTRAAARLGAAQRRAARGGDDGRPGRRRRPEDAAARAIAAVAERIATGSRVSRAPAAGHALRDVSSLRSPRRRTERRRRDRTPSPEEPTRWRRRPRRPLRPDRGNGRVVEERVADDATRVVLTRVELAPLHVVEVVAHLLLDARARARATRARAP
jgi:hypothetical protein